MQPIAFCSRCRGMKVGWNTRYIFHCLICRQWVSKSLKVLTLTSVAAFLIFAFPLSTGLVSSEETSMDQPVVAHASFIPIASKPAAMNSIESMLAEHGVKRELRPRVAKAIVASSLKYNLDPRLVTSVLLVESRANPFAISEADAIGIMQIHLPTWGAIAEKQGINLFKIEDNIDLGARILKGYVARHGLWEGVARYTGWAENPEVQQVALNYVRKVQKIYGYEPETESAQP